MSWSSYLYLSFVVYYILKILFFRSSLKKRFVNFFVNYPIFCLYSYIIFNFFSYLYTVFTKFYYYFLYYNIENKKLTLIMLIFKLVYEFMFSFIIIIHARIVKIFINAVESDFNFISIFKNLILLKIVIYLWFYYFTLFFLFIYIFFFFYFLYRIIKYIFKLYKVINDLTNQISYKKIKNNIELIDRLIIILFYLVKWQCFLFSYEEKRMCEDFRSKLKYSFFYFVLGDRLKWGDQWIFLNSKWNWIVKYRLKIKDYFFFVLYFQDISKKEKKACSVDVTILKEHIEFLEYFFFDLDFREIKEEDWIFSKESTESPFLFRYMLIHNYDIFVKSLKDLELREFTKEEEMTYKVCKKEIEEFSYIFFLDYGDIDIYIPNNYLSYKDLFVGMVLNKGYFDYENNNWDIKKGKKVVEEEKKTKEWKEFKMNWVSVVIYIFFF